MKPCAKYFACVLVLLFAPVMSAVAQTATPTPVPAPAAPKDPQALANNFPVPIGNQASGIRFPYSEDKKLKMLFNVGVMERKDLNRIEMTNAKIITYDDDQKPDVTLLLPTSVFNLSTRILKTNKPFVLKRADFEMMGETLRLDTVAKQATILGKIKMIIYNFQEEPGKESGHE